MLCYSLRKVDSLKICFFPFLIHREIHEEDLVKLLIAKQEAYSFSRSALKLIILYFSFGWLELVGELAFIRANLKYRNYYYYY